MRTVLSTSAITTLGTLPVFLISSQSVFIRTDLGFDEMHFGIAVSVFFGSAAICAIVGGRLVDGMGRRRGTIAGGLTAAAGGFAVALLAHSWIVLVMLMVVLGIANAACQLTSNLTMARVVPSNRQGLGFGVKQAAIPFSIMIAGLAVPVISGTVGWRWTFVLTGIGGLFVTIAGFCMHEDNANSGRTARISHDLPPVRALIITMLAVSFASAAANSFGSFVASWAFITGLTPAGAGLLMAFGSGANIIVRILVGHSADLRHGRNLPLVAAQMAIGAASLAFLSIESPYSVVSAGLVAFALGWSWPGLLLFAVVRVGRDAPGFASGMVQAGAFIGGATGPVLFGLAAETLGYETAWRLAAMSFLVAAVLILIARRAFVSDLRARPPVQPIMYGGGRGIPAHRTRRP